MKRLLSIVVSVLTSMCYLSAQTNEVIITPDWKVGDEIVYEKTIKSYRVSAQNDTTIKVQGTYDFHLHVVEKNDENYALNLVYPASIYKDLMPQLPNFTFNKPLSLKFTTDLLGRFVELTNYEEIYQSWLELIDAIYSPESFPNMTKEEFLAVIKKVYTPEVQIATVMKDINLLLWQNGIQGELGYIYEAQSTVGVGNMAIPAKLTYSLDADSIDGAPAVYVIDADTKLDKEALTPLLSSMMQNMMASLKDSGDFNDAALKEFISKSELSITDYHYIIFPINPIYAHDTKSLRETVITTPQGTMTEADYTNIRRIK